MEEEKFSKVFEASLTGIMKSYESDFDLIPKSINSYSKGLLAPLSHQNIGEKFYNDYIHENKFYDIKKSHETIIEPLENQKCSNFGDIFLKNTEILSVFNHKQYDINNINHFKQPMKSKLPTIIGGWAQNGTGNSISGIGNYYNFGTVLAEDLPEMALPIIDFIKDKKPHIVIGCDRGGRMFSLAIHATWQESEDQAFPTIDSKIHFTRISKSEDEAVLQEKVDAIIEQAKKLASQRGSEIEDDQQLRVLFVDDWVCGGGTIRLCERLMKKHDAETYFAVMVGPGADVSGDPNGSKSVSWSDDPHAIGINYLSSLSNDEHGNVKQELEVIAVRGSEAIRNRKKIHLAAKKLAEVAEKELVAA